MIWPIVIPIAAGLLVLCTPRALARHLKWVAVLVAAVVFGLCIRLYAIEHHMGGQSVPWALWNLTLLRMDALSALVALGVGFFSLLMTIYSAGFFRPNEISDSFYYGNLLLSIGAALGAVLAAHLALFAVFWGLLGIPLYLLIHCGSAGRKNGEVTRVAKKTMLILGGTDSVLVLGIAALYVQTDGSYSMFPGSALPVVGLLGWGGVVCFLIAALAKAGAMPFHTWVPEASEVAPVPAVALLPASVDKLLGIYLLARVFLTMYTIPDGLRVACLLIGAATIVFAVMSAMVQHNLRRLLGFHAVSQVGYMVVGIATGTAIGMVGALFHMFNNAIYKSCLFLSAGAAERRTGERELDRMGGLAKAMPLSFLATLIAAFAISGVPPLNGFASKWMLYNGIIGAQNLGFVWVIVLVAAMFGSALTLASFVKVLHSVYLGQPKKREHEGEKPNILMTLPMLVLALLCVVLGVFAVRIGVRELILPGLNLGVGSPTEASLNETVLGMWSSGTATVLLLAALVVGGVIYVLSTFTKAREDEPYVGGEMGDRASMYNYEGIEFYRTVRDMPLLHGLYRQAEAKWYDLYAQLRRLTFYITGWLRKLHDGLLHTYATWCVLGLVLLLWYLMFTYKVIGRAF